MKEKEINLFAGSKTFDNLKYNLERYSNVIQKIPNCRVLCLDMIASTSWMNCDFDCTIFYWVAKHLLQVKRDQAVSF